jgi:hypothetical protein
MENASDICDVDGDGEWWWDGRWRPSGGGTRDGCESDSGMAGPVMVESKVEKRGHQYTPRHHSQMWLRSKDRVYYFVCESS